jgi:hypothetical protein
MREQKVALGEDTQGFIGLVEKPHGIVPTATENWDRRPESS